MKHHLKTRQNLRTDDSLIWKSEPASGAEEVSPFLVEFFMVQGIGFRCMGYRDDDGRWRRAFDNELLAGQVWLLE
jgi:hypothetical protein